jgi:cytoskeleton protein RodZ
MADVRSPAEDRDSAAPASAGEMLRQARKAQGIHIAALAATLKVPPQKLELLESNRFGELPDPAFARALAKAVCRVLKIDPDPVLARLPQGTANRLERMEGGLRAPYQDHRGLDEPGELWSRFASPAVWGPALLIVGAVVVLLLPDSLQFPGADRAADSASAVVEAEPAEASAPPASDEPASAVAFAAAPQVAPPAASAVEATPPAAEPAASVPAQAGSDLVLRVSGNSWVQVTDGNQRILLSRELRAGETVNLDDPVPPLRVIVGNVRATQLEFRGEAVDLAARSRENIARLQLK